MIFWDDGTYRQEVFDLWQRNFHDPVSYAEFYFREVYGKNEVLLNPVREEGGFTVEKMQATGEESAAFQNEKEVLRGMLHLNPYTLRIKKQPEDAAYIVGVATDEQYRRQGVMRELLREAFLSLRERGQCLTYLMPADEQYYLPFDFRFGMVQVEQEIEYLPEASECTQKKSGRKETTGEPTGEADYVFLTELSDSQLSQAAEIENQEKDVLFDIYTEIAPAYLRRLEKEVESDFGQVFYVFKNGKYEGRFAAETENDYLILSQIFCAKKENREEFLRQAILFCAKKYHYQRYQIVTDPSWRDVLTDAGRSGNLRRIPAKRVKKIMFRILDVERLAGFLESRKDVSGDIYIEDRQIDEQDGRYHFLLREGKVTITKTADGNEAADGGKIDIGSLTEYLFSSRISDGDKDGGKEALPQESLSLPNSLTETGKEILQSILPLSEICIMEIV